MQVRAFAILSILTSVVIPILVSYVHMYIGMQSVQYNQLIS